MKYVLVFFITIISFACAQSVPKTETEELIITISPGEVRWVEFPISSSDTKMICKGSQVKYEQNGEVGRTFLTESYFSDLSPYKCQIEDQGRLLMEIKVSVKDREYPAEQLKVDSKKIKLSAKDEKRVQEEQAILNKIYASSLPRFLFAEAFMAPMNSVVTSIYGTKRLYNKQKKGQHLGIDYRASIGEKIPATNSGKVVFSGNLFYTGYTVIIDHGVDIFTIYGHLSKTLVNTGDMIKRGDLIGLSGNTGRTSGPHLHWGAKIQGQYIDGFVLIEESKKYFKK